MKRVLFVITMFAVGCASPQARNPAQDSLSANALRCGKDIVSVPVVTHGEFSWETGKFSGSITDGQTGIAGISFAFGLSQPLDNHHNFIRGAQTYGILGSAVGSKVPAGLQMAISDVFEVPTEMLVGAKSISIYPINVCDNIGTPITFRRK